MSDLNILALSGNLGRNFELRWTSGAEPKAVASNSIAVSSGYGDRKKTHWFELTFWGKSAENAAKLLSKGSKITVQGRLEVQEWNDKQTGDKKSRVQVVVSEWFFAGSPPEKQAAQDGPPRERRSSEQQESASGNDGDEDDIPF